MKSKPFGDVAIIILLAGISYAIFGAPYSFRFNSDNAIHVLMAADFDWNEDFYFWAQNRIGSLSPWIASWLVGVGVAPIHAVAIVKYGWLLSIALIGRKLIQNSYFTLLLTISLFFPSIFYFSIIQIGHPYPEQLSIILFSLLIVKQYADNGKKIPPFKLGLIGGLFSLALWANESTFIFVGIFSVFLLISRRLKLLNFSNSSAATYAVTLIIPTIYFVQRKLATPDYSGYSDNSINPFPVFIDSLFSWVASIKQLFVFNDALYLTTLMAALGTLLIFATFAFILRLLLMKKYEFSSLLVPTVLILTAVAFYIVVCLSEWYILNYSHSRYLIAPYYLFFIGVLILLNQYSDIPPYFSKGLGILVFVITLLSAASGIIINNSRGFRVEESEKSELTQLYGKGVLGNYWFSYAISAYEPYRIAATPHQLDYTRNYGELIKAISKDTIFLVKNNWLDVYPDTLKQHGVLLKRLEPPHDIKVGNAFMSGYRRIED